MPEIPIPAGPFLAQAWKGEERVLHIEDLSIDAARHIACAHAALGQTGRVMAQASDYCEVYPPDGSYREGTFAQTTLVRFASEEA